MSYNVSIDQSTVQQWLAAKFDEARLEKELAAKGLDADAIAHHIKAFKKAKNDKKQSAGFIYLAIGATFGFFGCVLALINPIPELYGVFLYGLTSIALVFIFIGFYFIFE